LKSRRPKDKDVKLYSENMANDPDSLAFVPLAELYRDNGMVDQAIQMCLQGLQRHPENAQARILLAACLADSGKIKDAQRHLKGVLQLVPNNKKAKAVLKELMETGKIGNLSDGESSEIPRPSQPAPKREEPALVDQEEDLLDFDDLFGDDEGESKGAAAEKMESTLLDDLKMELGDGGGTEERSSQEDEEDEEDDGIDFDSLLGLEEPQEQERLDTVEKAMEEDEEEIDLDSLPDWADEAMPEEKTPAKEDDYDFSFLDDMEDDSPEDKLEILADLNGQDADVILDQTEEDLDFLGDLDLGEEKEEKEKEEEILEEEGTEEDLDFLGDLDLGEEKEEKEKEEEILEEEGTEEDLDFLGDLDLGEEKEEKEKEEEILEEEGTEEDLDFLGDLDLGEEEEEKEKRPFIGEQETHEAEMLPTELMTSEDGLDAILCSLTTPDEVMGAMVVGSDGFVVASKLKQDMDLEKMAALLASIIETADRSTQRMKLGGFRGILVETDTGTIHLANRQGITLVVLSDTEARLGLIRIRMHNALDSLRQYLY